MPPNQNPAPGVPQQPNQLPTPAGPPQNPGQYPSQPGQIPAPAPGAIPNVQPATPVASQNPADSTPAVPPDDATPYDFFMKEQRAQRQLFSLPTSTSAKLIAGCVGLLVVMGLLALIMSAANSGKSGGVASLEAAAQEQQELIRLATDGEKNTHDTNIENFAVTTDVTLSSDQRKLLSLVKHNGGKVDAKTLALAHSAQTDQALAAAIAANTYDGTYTTIMKSEFNKYIADLNGAASNATPSVRAIIERQNADAQLLAKMLNPQQ